MLVEYFRPFSQLFGPDLNLWLEQTLFTVVWVAGKTLYLFGIKRGEGQRVQLAALEEEIRSWRLQWMSFLPRAMLQIGMLALVILDTLGWWPLQLAVPLLLLLALTQLNVILRPGEAVMPDASDELLLFFRARMLKAGYVTAIITLAAIYVVSLYSVRYLAYLLPAGITLSLLVPAVVYHRLDSRAGANG